MIEETPVRTRVIEYRDPRDVPSRPEGRARDTDRSGALAAVCLTDILDDGFSLVYSFFEPELQSSSLGTYVILDHVTLAREAGLPYVYLGYWVPGSPKMGYKSNFSALEVHVGGQWQPIGDLDSYSTQTHPLSTDPIAQQVAQITLPDLRGDT